MSISDAASLKKVVDNLISNYETMSSEDVNSEIVKIRKYSSTTDGTKIDEIVNTGIVPFIMSTLLQGNLSADMKFELAWIATNIASGSSSNVDELVQSGFVPIAVKHIDLSDQKLSEQFIWALGNIAGDSPANRDFCLESQVLDPLLNFIQNSPGGSPLRNAVWTLSNLVRGKPSPNFDSIKKCIPFLHDLLSHTDEDVLVDALWGLSYISDGTNERIQILIDRGITKCVVNHLDSLSNLVVTPALRVIGNMLTGTDSQTEAVLKFDKLFPLFKKLLSSSKISIRKETLWSLSNICAGTKSQIQKVIDNNLLPKVAEMLLHETFDVRCEAMYTIANAISGCSESQALHIIQKTDCLLNVIKAVREDKGNKLFNIGVEAIADAMKIGKKISKKTTEHPFSHLIRDDIEMFEEILEDGDISETTEKKISEILEIYQFCKVLTIFTMANIGEKSRKNFGDCDFIFH